MKALSHTASENGSDPAFVVETMGLEPTTPCLQSSTFAVPDRSAR